MCWYKSNLAIGILGCGLFLIAVLPACKPEIKETGTQLKYFDLDGYFKKDSVRFTKQNPLISKTVSQNNIGESKKVHIANWGAELSMFESSDINKPAWRDSYTTQDSDGVTLYKATDPELKTQEIKIKQANGQVKWIMIYNHTKNFLFETTEELSFYPDSLYQINKKQSVIFLGTNYYKIKGLFN